MFQDVMENAFDRMQGILVGFTVGFFAPVMESAIDPVCPNVVQALTLAGVQDMFVDFEQNLWGRNATKRISTFFALSIIKRFDTDWTYFDPCDPLGNYIYWRYLIEDLLKAIETRYGANLLRMAQTYFQASYDPLENYDMTQTETPNITRETNLNVASKNTTTSNNDGSLYGFNSATEVPVSASDSEVTSEGKYADNYSYGIDKETGTRTLTRHGNIGVTTSQMMAQSELDLRKFDFLQYVYKCFEEVLFSKVY